jgi:hypothetical protein
MELVAIERPRRLVRAAPEQLDQINISGDIQMSFIDMHEDLDAAPIVSNYNIIITVTLTTPEVMNS